jgi:hypothetical protein
MIARVVIVLVCLGIAFAPAALADGESAGSCVWTAHNGTQVSAGYNARDCASSGGQWFPSPA